MILLDASGFHFDMTVSVWELAVVVVLGGWRLIVMHFEVKDLRKCVEELEGQKELVNQAGIKVAENAVLIKTTLEFMKSAIAELKQTVENLRNERSSRRSPK